MAINNTKITIIVPVYNVEKYLDKCILSLQNQDVEELQLLFVNDGTQDHSREIVEHYAAKDSRINILDKPNGGQSSARNYGMKFAVGKYVLFVDSDDYLEPNCLGALYHYAEERELDILQASYQKIINGRTQMIEVPLKIEEPMTGVEWTRAGYEVYGACFCLYRRGFLEENHILFMEGVYHEDMDFPVYAAWKAKRIAATDQVFYNYVNREGSTTNHINLKRCVDLFLVAEKVRGWVTAEADEQTKEMFFNDYVTFLYSHAVNLCVEQNFSISDFFKMNEQIRPITLEQLKKNSRKEYQLEYLLLKLRLYGLYSALYRFYQKTKK